VPGSPGSSSTDISISRKNEPKMRTPIIIFLLSRCRPGRPGDGRR
jgi:hypothetical protein